MPASQTQKYSIEDALFVLLLPCAFLFTLRLHNGIGIGDAGDYFNAAYNLAHGIINVKSNFYANRIGTTAPVALVMHFFNYYGRHLTYISTIFFLALLTAVYVAFRPINKQWALFAVGIIAGSEVVIQSSAVLMGDIGITLLANAPVLLYARLTLGTTGTLNKVKMQWWGLVGGFIFIAAFLTKESIAFYVPLLLYLFYVDRKYEARRRFWIVLFATAAIGILLTCFWYLNHTGQFLYRLRSVAMNPSRSECNYQNVPFTILLSRLSWKPLQFLLENYSYGMLLLLSGLSFLVEKKDAALKFVQTWLLFIVLMWWLGPQGLPWNPVALAPRLWLPAIIPMALTGAWVIYYLTGNSISLSEKWKMAITIIGFAAIASLLLYYSSEQYKAIGIEAGLFAQWKAYMLLCAVLLAALFVNDERLPNYLPPVKRVVALAIIGWPLLGQFNTIAYGLFSKEKSEYDYEQQMVLKVEALQPDCILVDKNLAEKYHVYDGYLKNYPFTDWNTISTQRALDSLPANTWLLINVPRTNYARKNLAETRIYTPVQHGIINFNQLPFYVETAPDRFGFELVDSAPYHQLWRKARRLTP